MKKAGWITLVAVLFAIVIAVGWQLRRPVDIALPVLNRSEEPVQLMLYGAGLTEHILITELPPRDSMVVTLHLARSGAIRIKTQSPRAQIDAVLLDSGAALRRNPQQLEIRPDNQFVLVPRG